MLLIDKSCLWAPALVCCTLLASPVSTSANQKVAATTWLENGKKAEAQGDVKTACGAYYKALMQDSSLLEAHVHYIDAMLRFSPAAGAKKLDKYYAEQGKRDGLLLGVWYWQLATVTPAARAGDWYEKSVQLCPGLAPFLRARFENAKDIELALACADGLAILEPHGYQENLKSVLARFPNASLKQIEWVTVKLARSLDSEPERQKVLESFFEKVAQDKSVMCLTATGDLYRSYTYTDSAKALAYARVMAATPNARSHWKEAVKVQEILAQAQRHNANGQYQDAATLLDPYCLKNRKDQVNAENATEGSLGFLIAWADAYLGLGKGRVAYEALLGQTAHSYNPLLREVLGRLGKANGKSEAQVKEDLLKALAQKPEPFTTFRLKDYQNRTIDLKDYRGRVVLVNFWFPTCVPCREEFELLKTLYPASGESKVVILTINCAKTLDSSVPKVFAAQHYPFVALKMPDDAWAKRVYGVTGAPSNFLLDREGRLVSRPTISDPHQLESFRNLVDLLNEK